MKQTAGTRSGGEQQQLAILSLSERAYVIEKRRVLRHLDAHEVADTDRVRESLLAVIRAGPGFEADVDGKLAGAVEIPIGDERTALARHRLPEC